MQYCSGKRKMLNLHSPSPAKSTRTPEEDDADEADDAAVDHKEQVVGFKPSFEVISLKGKAQFLKASADEVKANPRSESAKLRVAQRTANPPTAHNWLSIK